MTEWARNCWMRSTRLQSRTPSPRSPLTTTGQSYGSDEWLIKLSLVSTTTTNEDEVEITNLVPKLSLVPFDEKHLTKLPKKSGSTTGSGSGKGVTMTVEYKDGRVVNFDSAAVAGRKLVNQTTGSNKGAIASKIGNNVDGVKRVLSGGEQIWPTS